MVRLVTCGEAAAAARRVAARPAAARAGAAANVAGGWGLKELGRAGGSRGEGAVGAEAGVEVSAAGAKAAGRGRARG